MQALLEAGLKEIKGRYQHVAAYLCSDLNVAKEAMSHIRQNLKGGFETFVVRADEPRANVDVCNRHIDTSKILFVSAKTEEIFDLAKDTLRRIGHTNNLLEGSNAAPRFAPAFQPAYAMAANLA